jgi:hypothetical protein
MNEEMSIGVKILLERVKSNPEEMAQEYGKWHQLRDAVFAYKEDGQRRAWIRGLRQDEIDLLYEAFCTGSRQIFDDYVLKNVLGADEEEKQPVDAYTLSQGKRAVGGGGIYNPHQNAVQPMAVPPGSWQNVASQTSSTSVVAQQSLVARLKQELGIK